MTAVADTDTSRRFVALGSPAFIAILSMAMAVTALGVDTVLPAYGELREAFDLEPDSAEVTGVITFYLMGNAVGLLPAGLISDRFGRKAVMWGGLAVYIAAAIGAVLAPSLTWLFVFRFLWGLGSAGPRVAALAMVRDGFVGEQMAKQMSLMMAVFLLVPAIGPALGAGVLAVASWEWVFLICVVVAVMVAVAVGRLPETLAVDDRRPLMASSIWASCREVVRTPGTVWFLLALSALFTSFMSFLSGAELIIDQTYGLADWFPAFFAVAALSMLAAMLANGRLVERVGLDRLIGRLFGAAVVATSAMLMVAIVTGGEPPVGVFVAMICCVLVFQQMLIPNLNSAAMRPLGAVAGTGTAILGMVAGVVGALLAEVVNGRFDGTMRPLAVTFVLANAVAVFAWRRARSVTPVVG